MSPWELSDGSGVLQPTPVQEGASLFGILKAALVGAFPCGITKRCKLEPQ